MAIAAYDTFKRNLKDLNVEELIKTLKTKNKLDYLDCDYDNDLYEEINKGNNSKVTKSGVTVTKKKKE